MKPYRERSEVQVIVREGYNQLEVWDADDLLFALNRPPNHADDDRVIEAALTAYNAGRASGESHGRSTLQLEIRRLLDVEPASRS